MVADYAADQETVNPRGPQIYSPNVSSLAGGALKSTNALQGSGRSGNSHARTAGAVSRFKAGLPLEPGQVLALQASAGNGAVARLLRSREGMASRQRLPRTAGSAVASRSVAPLGQLASASQQQDALTAQRAIEDESQEHLFRDVSNSGSAPILLRSPAAPDIELFFTFEHEGRKLKRVSDETLAFWVARKLKEGLRIPQIIVNLLNSRDFTGSDVARKHWAAVVENQLEYLLGIVVAKNEEAVRRSKKAALQEEFKRFMSGTYSGRYKFGSGHFDAVYEPTKQTLTVSVPVMFTFIDSEANWAENTGTKDKPNIEFKSEVRRWADSKAWRARFISQVESFWSKHELLCARSEWEGARAKVQVQVNDLGEVESAGSEAFQVMIYRGDTPRPSEVNKNRATLGYDDLKLRKGGGSVAAHEFGHMLGLDDEYYDPNKPNQQSASHSDLVKAHFGYAVPRLEERTDVFKDSIMFDIEKGKVLAEHGVIFLDAMTQITKVPDWKVRLAG